MSSTVDDAGTALLIEVADFNNDSGNPLSTHLRLGTVDGAVATAYGNDTTGILATSLGEDLASQVTTFVDDERERGSDGDKFYTLTKQQRRDETTLLHTKGGWRDHTDGNRITTTRGDKVEVIGGNYKLLVLGREQWNDDAGGGLRRESSGGISYQYDEVPGQIIDVRWSSTDGTWTVMEECQTGHFVARYHGVDKDWHAGGDLVTRIGSLGAYKVAHEHGVWADVKADHGFKSDDDFDKPADASHQKDADWPGDSTLPDVREETFAGEIREWVFADTIEEIDGESGRPVDKIEKITYADDIEDWQVFLRYHQTMTGGKAEENWKGFFLELFVTAAITAKWGAFCDTRWGYASTAINISPMIGQVNLVVKRLGLDLSLLKLSCTAAGAVTTGRWTFLHTEVGNQVFKFGTVKKETCLKKNIN